MITATDMTTMLAQNLRVIGLQTEGLTHGDSMLQLPFRGNCLNWVLGHMLVSRDYMLRIAGAETLWDADKSTPYMFGSEAMTAEADAVPMESILADLQRSQECLAEAMTALDDGTLDAPFENERDDTLRKRLAFMTWHDSYHTGQTEYLRQLSGVSDKVI
ncbi:MAG: DinB family protein [Anaerolineaceae bacterium]|nr:DinB family protein [Anaerolineaceae bacterium]